MPADGDDRDRTAAQAETAYYRRLADDLGRQLLHVEEERRRVQIRVERVSRINRLLFESGRQIGGADSIEAFSAHFLASVRSILLCDGAAVFQADAQGRLRVRAAAGLPFAPGEPIAVDGEPPAYGWVQLRRASDPFTRGLAGRAAAAHAAFVHTPQEAAALLLVRHRVSTVLEAFDETTQELATAALEVFCWALQRKLLHAALQESEKRSRLLASVFEASGESVIVTDAAGRIVAVNRAFTRLTGFGLEELHGKSPLALAALRLGPGERRAVARAVAANDGWQGEVAGRRKGGGSFPAWLNISTLRDGDGVISHYIGSFFDISERKAAEERTRHIAEHDALTGLPNRMSLQARLEPVLAEARRGKGELAVMFIDLDRFKFVNDTFGHGFGDQLLVQVAQRLRGGLRASDILARLGGDEFVVVLSHLAGGAEAAGHVAAKILDRLDQPFDVAGRPIAVTGSIGISLFPRDGDTVETLMKGADLAMYKAKGLGRANYQFFESALNQAVAARLDLESELRGAIERDELVLHYQPQVDLADGRVVGLEALVRWRHPRHGLLGPDEFIGVAEESGLIVRLGEWVLKAACRALAALDARGPGGLRMAVNISAQQLTVHGFVEFVLATVRENRLAANRVELEITETAAMSNAARTLEVFRQLRAGGVRLALDDFGSGYSSLAYLREFPIDLLKLDRSFIQDIERDEVGTAVCGAAIMLGRSLGIQVIAEGVETDAQLRFLARNGADLAQGFLLARPQPFDALPACLEQDFGAAVRGRR